MPCRAVSTYLMLDARKRASLLVPYADKGFSPLPGSFIQRLPWPSSGSSVCPWDATQQESLIATAWMPKLQPATDPLMRNWGKPLGVLHICRSQGSQQPPSAPWRRQSRDVARPATAGELHALEAVAAEICLAINKAESKAWTCGLTGVFLPCQREASAMQGGRDVCPSAGWTVAVEPLPCGHRGRRRVLSRSGLVASPTTAWAAPALLLRFHGKHPPGACAGEHSAAAVRAFTYRP